jgi:acyl-CoA thioester hydrolase
MSIRSFFAGWGDMDFNSHMKNTAYLDKCADSRMLFFQEQGFPMTEFKRLQIGPVVMKDEIEYYREIQLLEFFTVKLFCAGLSQDGSRFSIVNEFYRSDGIPTAKVSSAGGWLDLSTRKLIVAPTPLLAVLNNMPRTDNFQSLSSSIKNG